MQVRLQLPLGFGYRLEVWASDEYGLVPRHYEATEPEEAGTPGVFPPVRSGDKMICRLAGGNLFI